jgi:outer membrane immunogenic protein
MKKLFLGSVALVALGLGAPAANAADMRVAAYAPPPPPAYTWSGCYAGASAGTSSGRTDGFSATAASGAATLVGSLAGSQLPLIGGTQLSRDFNLSGFIGGFQAGCNWQAGAWVFGIEGDGSATNKSGQAFEALTSIPTVSGPITSSGQRIYELQERWLVTARGRLGLTNFWWFGPNTFVYATGGAAWAKIDSSQWNTEFATSPLTSAVQQSDTRIGWTVGGGLEYALGYGWSAKGEYLYVDFGDFTTFTCSAPAPGCPLGTRTSLNVNLKDHIFRAGMNYKFW